MSNTTGNPDAGHPAEAATAGRWVLDPAHSSVRFHSKTFWGLVTVKGTFGAVTGEGEVGSDGAVHGTLSVDAASVDTKNAKRDKHLRSADFFSADQHAAIVFTANSVTPSPVSPDSVQVTGDLTVAGTSRPLAFPARITSATADEATLEAEVTVDRADFGITWNQLGMLKGASTVLITARYRHAA
jgi:polyisoprenoid-binding protein YceI